LCPHRSEREAGGGRPQCCEQRARCVARVRSEHDGAGADAGVRAACGGATRRASRRAPQFCPASAAALTPPLPTTHLRQVQQAGANMVADLDLSDRQAKFLEERNKMQQKYEAQSEVQGNYLTAAETEEKKGKSIGVVGGLIIIAFVAPMVQFFYYTGGE
jgi:hypothetical protein